MMKAVCVISSGICLFGQANFLSADDQVTVRQLEIPTDSTLSSRLLTSIAEDEGRQLQGGKKRRGGKKGKKSKTVTKKTKKNKKTNNARNNVNIQAAVDADTTNENNGSVIAQEISVGNFEIDTNTITNVLENHSQFIDNSKSVYKPTIKNNWKNNGEIDFDFDNNYSYSLSEDGNYDRQLNSINEAEGRKLGKKSKKSKRSKKTKKTKKTKKNKKTNNAQGNVNIQAAVDADTTNENKASVIAQTISAGKFEIDSNTETYVNENHAQWVDNTKSVYKPTTTNNWKNNDKIDFDYDFDFSYDQSISEESEDKESEVNGYGCCGRQLNSMDEAEVRKLPSCCCCP